MPRAARIDAPGALHHVIARGIEGRPLFHDDEDRADFSSRLARLAAEGAFQVYAWALLPNHVHLLCETAGLPLSTAMQRLLTGYAVTFNKRHGRRGHLFQNRFRSLLCQREPYLKELVRYIHLNPVRAGVLRSLEELGGWPWSGHSALLGRIPRPWQETGRVLSFFAHSPQAARTAYLRFIASGLSRAPRDLGLERLPLPSSGNWSEVVPRRHRGEFRSTVERCILGDRRFVAEMIGRMERRQQRSFRLDASRPDMASVCRRACEAWGLSAGELCAGSRRRPVVEARMALSWLAVRELGYSGAEVARFLGVSTSCITRAAAHPMPDGVETLRRGLGGEKHPNGR